MHGLRHKKRKSVLFTRFLASYLALLALPILLFSYIVASTTEKIKKNAIAQSTTVLEQARDHIDNKMRSLYNGVIGINYNTIINRVLDAEKVHDVADVMMSFKDLSAFEQDSDQLYVYADSIDSLLSTKGCYSHIDKIYGTVLRYGDMDYTEFRDTFLLQTHNGHFVPATHAVIDSQPTRTILYVQSIPIGSRGQKQGNILYFVQESAILEPLQNLHMSDDGWLSITDKDGAVITGFGTYPDNLSELVRQSATTNVSYSGDLILVSARSSYNGWQYTAAIPKNYILGESNSVRVTVLVLLVLYMLLGVCFAYFVSVRNFKPWQEITELVRDGITDNAKQVDEYHLLRSYVENLADSNRNLETSLGSYAKAMESTQITNLICGRYHTPADLEEFAACKHIMRHRWFTVVLVDFFPRMTEIDQSVLDALVLRRLMAKQAVAELELSGLAMGEIDVNKLGLLFYSDETPALDEPLRLLQQKLCNSLQGQVCIGMGSSCEGFQQISFSSLQADCALRVATQENNILLHFNDIPHQSEDIYFPDNLRSVLQQSIAAGNLKQTKSTLKILDLENFTTRVTSPKGTAELLHEMRQLFVHLHNNDNTIEIPDPNKDLDAHAQFDYYSGLLLRICNQNTDVSESRNSKLCDEILQFINDNYSDSNLCLSKLATRFNLSEAYLSYLFKKMLNVNFSNYLEEKRIAKSMEILQDGSSSIEEVATRVGYNSPHAFRRAFKKVAGTTPRDMRKKN